MSSREFLPSEVARLVLSYLLENNYDGTKEIFMSECPALAELKSLTPHTLIHNSTVNGRTLSKILKDYMRWVPAGKYVKNRQFQSNNFQFDREVERACGGCLQWWGDWWCSVSSSSQGPQLSGQASLLLHLLQREVCSSHGKQNLADWTGGPLWRFLLSNRPVRSQSAKAVSQLHWKSNSRGDKWNWDCCIIIMQWRSGQVTKAEGELPKSQFLPSKHPSATAAKARTGANSAQT